MNTALVTGPAEEVDSVASALNRQGFDALVWKMTTGGVSDRSLGGPVDCYVQLPPASAARLGEGAGGAEAGSLMCRLDAVGRIAQVLAPDAAVLLVDNESGCDPDHGQTLHALAAALVAKRAGSGIRVALVESDEAGDIAVAARRERDRARSASFADLEPGMAYTAWRDQVFNLTCGNNVTYLGWRRPDGAQRLAVLRRSVLSPLSGAIDGSVGLARAVLTDAFGPSTLSDLERSDLRLADDFQAEVIESLPVAEFELSIKDVAAWAVRRSLVQSA